MPLVEEIFWRSLLLRYLISEKFETVPFGAFSWMSFAVVAVAFALSHQKADWPAALVTGVLYNLVACRTKSSTSCVLTTPSRTWRSVSGSSQPKRGLLLVEPRMRKEG